MAKYDKATIERQFRAAASLRIRKKERKNPNYANDAGYWSGGKCNWGGSHNLSEDCETLAFGFDKMEELKKVEKELQQCTSKEEFDSTKSRLTRQAEEVERSLQVQTGASSSMFGICIIWAEYNDFIESKLRPLRSEVSRLKGNISNQQYKYYEEIKLLKLEQKQIEARMKENKKKAQEETDPDKKALLLLAIEEDGKKLKENLEKQKSIPTSNLNFEPDKYVSDLIESMKKAISENRGEGGNNPGDGSGRSPCNNGGESDDDNNNGNDPDGDGNNGSRQPRKRHRGDNSNFFRDNQQLIIIAGISLLALFYFMNQKTEPSPPRNYPDYDF